MNTMNIHKRDFCILCENKSKLIDIKTIQIPAYLIKPDDLEKNETWDMTYGYCETCYSIQLKTLLDPSILYDKNYILPISSSYTWVQHNISFINFIIHAIEINKPLLEIGSSSFVLGKHLFEYYKDFTVFDYSLSQVVKRDGVKYIEGDCENYIFDKNTNIIMSHVFEHLYEPRKFIENCRNCQVENIIISIPSMNDLTDVNVFNIHTFLYNEDDIEYIFKINNYKLCNKFAFNSNDGSFPCFFFHFTSLRISNEQRCKLDTGSNEITSRNIIHNRHLNFIKFANSFTVPKNTYLATASYYGLTIFHSINNENIIGVIDYDKVKQNKKFGNTDLIIQPYEYLKNCSSSDSILVFGYRTPDIINCIRNVNKDINIIELKL